MILSVSAVSAADENVTQEVAVEESQNLQVSDVNQGIVESDDSNIDVEGPDEMVYRGGSEFTIHSKGGVEGTVYAYLNNQTYSSLDLAENATEDSATPFYIWLDNPGNYNVDFKLFSNGVTSDIKSFNYAVSKFNMDLYYTFTIHDDYKQLSVNMPYDASGDLEVTVNGQKQVKKVDTEMGYTAFELNDVALGTNKVYINYVADSQSKYKSQSLVKQIFVKPSIYCDYEAKYGSENAFKVYAPGLTGKFNLKIDGEDYKTIDVNDEAGLGIVNLVLGKHTFEASYTDGKYDNVLCEEFEIIPNVDIPAFVKKGDASSLTVKLSDIASGNLIVSLNDAVIYKNASAKSSHNIPLNNLKKYNEVLINYTDANSAFERSFSVTCTENNPKWDMKVDAYDFVSTQDDRSTNFIGINTPDDYDGDITILIDGKYIDSTYSFDASGYEWDGVKYCEVRNVLYIFNKDDLTLGPHTMQVIANNSKYYEPVNKTVSFTATNLGLPDLKSTLSYNQIVNIDIPNDAKGTIKIYIDDKLKFTLKDDDICAIFMPEDLSFGKHTFKLVYSGDKKYPSETITKKFNYVYRIFPRYKNWLFFNDEQFAEGNKNILIFEAPYVFEGTVTIKINGETLKSKVKGTIAEFDISKFKAGNYTVKVEYQGKGKFYKDSYNMDIEILPKLVNIKANDLTVYYNAGSYYTVKVLNIDGSVAKKVPVAFYINGATTSKKTNDDGVVKFKINENPGKYSVFITSKYSVVFKKVTVKHVVGLKAVKVKKSAKSLVLTATLKQGKTPLKNKKITFKFNGKKYTAKTNSKGVAKVTVKNTVLKKLKVGKKVTYQATYLKDTVKKTVKVLK